MIAANRREASLIIFCRRPEHGIGKQRIARLLGDQIALDLAEHLLAAALEDAEHWPGPVILSPANPEDLDWAQALSSRDYRVIAQSNGNLGQRINAVDQAARIAGHTQLIYVGSDAPVLDEEYFSLARAALATHDIVLGPAEDGGVTLMGARRQWPDLTELPWSSANLGGELELTCLQAGLTVCILEPRYDIDRDTDLPRLHEDLRGDARPARRKLHLWLAETGLVPCRKPNENIE
jgi:rSAM/selenodomain-associated transferase 1